MKHLMRLVLFAFAIACVTDAHARDALRYRLVPFDDFMQHTLEPAVPLAIPVPVEYEPLDPDRMSADVDYSYWMRESDMRRAIRTEDLPSRSGYMYGKISLDVGYDREADRFVGLEEEESLAEARRTMGDFRLERFDHPTHPVALVTWSDPDSGKRACAMYVAMNRATNAAFIALRPKGNSRATGDALWDALRRSLLDAGYVRRRAE